MSAVTTVDPDCVVPDAAESLEPFRMTPARRRALQWYAWRSDRSLPYVEFSQYGNVEAVLFKYRLIEVRTDRSGRRQSRRLTSAGWRAIGLEPRDSPLTARKRQDEGARSESNGHTSRNGQIYLVKIERFVGFLCERSPEGPRRYCRCPTCSLARQNSDATRVEYLAPTSMEIDKWKWTTEQRFACRFSREEARHLAWKIRSDRTIAYVRIVRLRPRGTDGKLVRDRDDHPHAVVPA